MECAVIYKYKKKDAGIVLKIIINFKKDQIVSSKIKSWIYLVSYPFICFFTLIVFFLLVDFQQKNYVTIVYDSLVQIYLVWKLCYHSESLLYSTHRNSSILKVVNEMNKMDFPPDERRPPTRLV